MQGYPEYRQSRLTEFTYRADHLRSFFQNTVPGREPQTQCSEQEMTTEQSDLLNQRLNRIQQAVALKKPDRVPVVLEYSAFAAYATNTLMADFLKLPGKAIDTMMECYGLVGEGDAINYGTFWVYGLCSIFMARVRVPGVDWPENDVWSVDEREIMTREDYRAILDRGWPDYREDFLKNRLLDTAPTEMMPPQWGSGDVKGKWASLGVPVLSGGDVTTPYEVLCGSRSLPSFAVDLYEIPDLIEEVMDAIVPHLSADAVQSALDGGYPCVWIGGWRTAPEMLSPAMWNRYVWPYMCRLVNEVVDAGLIPILHLDSNWERELARFRELPRGKCIMALDGSTDIITARKELDGYLCVMGDVPASMLYLDSPDKVYDYSARLIRELGPTGFILQSGCDIPANAKLENVKAMVTAAVS